MYTTNLISGVVFVVLGVVFIAYEGTSALSSLYQKNGAADLAHLAEGWVSSFASSIPDAFALLIATLALLAIVVFRRRHRHSKRRKEKERQRQQHGEDYRDTAVEYEAR